MTLISHSPGGWNPRSQCPCCWLFGRVVFQVADSRFLTVSSHGRKRDLWPLSLLIRAVILFTGFQPHNQVIGQRSHLQITSLWGLGFKYMNFGGTQVFAHGQQKLWNSCCFPNLPLVVPLMLYLRKGGGVIPSFLGYPYNSSWQG